MSQYKNLAQESSQDFDGGLDFIENYMQQNPVTELQPLNQEIQDFFSQVKLTNQQVANRFFDQKPSSSQIQDLQNSLQKDRFGSQKSSQEHISLPTQKDLGATVSRSIGSVQRSSSMKRQKSSKINKQEPSGVAKKLKIKFKLKKQSNQDKTDTKEKGNKEQNQESTNKQQLESQSVPIQSSQFLRNSTQEPIQNKVEYNEYHSNVKDPTNLNVGQEKVENFQLQQQQVTVPQQSGKGTQNKFGIGKLKRNSQPVNTTQIKQDATQENIGQPSKQVDQKPSNQVAVGQQGQARDATIKQDFQQLDNSMGAGSIRRSQNLRQGQQQQSYNIDAQNNREQKINQVQQESYQKQATQSQYEANKSNKWRHTQPQNKYQKAHSNESSEKNQQASSTTNKTGSAVKESSSQKKRSFTQNIQANVEKNQNLAKQVSQLPDNQNKKQKLVNNQQNNIISTQNNNSANYGLLQQRSGKDIQKLLNEKQKDTSVRQLISNIRNGPPKLKFYNNDKMDLFAKARQNKNKLSGILNGQVQEAAKKQNQDENCVTMEEQFTKIARIFIDMSCQWLEYGRLNGSKKEYYEQVANIIQSLSDTLYKELPKNLSILFLGLKVIVNQLISFTHKQAKDSLSQELSTTDVHKMLDQTLKTTQNLLQNEIKQAQQQSMMAEKNLNKQNKDTPDSNQSTNSHAQVPSTTQTHINGSTPQSQNLQQTYVLGSTTSRIPQAEDSMLNMAYLKRLSVIVEVTKYDQKVQSCQNIVNESLEQFFWRATQDSSGNMINALTYLQLMQNGGLDLEKLEPVLYCCLNEFETYYNNINNFNVM